MQTKFVSTDACPAAGLVDTDGNTDFFLRQTKFFAQILDSFSND